MATSSRRDRVDGQPKEQQEEQEETSFTDFQNKCKEVLEKEMKYTKVLDGKTFGAHLHCYRNEGPNHHEHGETLVLCIENSKTEQLDSDLRYLSVASRIANATRKRCLVAFETKSKKVRMIELVSIT